MKTFKKVIATALVATMAVSCTGCGALKIKATDAKSFNKALSKLSDDMAEAIDDFDEEWGFGFSDNYLAMYEKYDDADDIEDELDIENAEEYIMGYCTDEDEEAVILYEFISFEDTESAHDYFNEEWYEDYSEAKKDKDLDGTMKDSLSKTSGYIILDVESDSKDLGKGNIYGGIYFADNTVVIVMGMDASKSSKKEIDSFLESIEYPFL